MGLQTKDKQPKPSGWGYTFEHTVPQRRMCTVAGDLLVPASADDLSPVPEEHVATVERAITLVADLLSDRDHQRFLGDHQQLNGQADAEAAALRRLVGPGGALRAVLRFTPEGLTQETVRAELALCAAQINALPEFDAAAGIWHDCCDWLCGKRPAALVERIRSSVHARRAAAGPGA